MNSNDSDAGLTGALRRACRRLGGLLAFGCLALVANPAAAVTPADLLPVDQAFALSAEATAPDRVELHWKIADGYYLYRHRTSATADAAFGARPLQLPAGEAHQDEYFGRVETYRSALTGVLQGTAGPARVSVKVRYQGCADAGLCYPPQTRTLTVDLPSAGGPIGREAPGAAPARSLIDSLGLGRGSGATDRVPLPDAQAFGFDAVATDGNTLLLRFSPARGYYVYRDKIRLTLGPVPGLTLGTPRWPPAQRHRDEHFGEVAVYFEPVEVAVPVHRTRPDAATTSLRAEFQGCQTEGICYPPMTRSVRVAIPAGAVATARPSPATAAGAIEQVPVPSAGPTPPGRDPAAASVNAITTTSTPAEASPGGASAGPARTPPPATARLGLAGALLAALLGGLVLNLMPCVLPVLSLKAMSLAGTAESPAQARRHAFAYTAGVLLSFVALGATALALRQAGLALGWGFQLQQPVVVAGLALLMFALGLSLSGVWHAGGRWTGVGQALTARTGPVGDFFTGVLAVVVATPCTAPFMGAALAWAFTAPTLLALAVFATLGLGLALPFLLIGLVPALAHRLPRPGAWMETLKQLLAFPLYLTAVWLAWVLARQRGADAVGWWMVAAVLLAFAAWAWTHGRMRGRSAMSAAAVVALLAMVLPLGAIARLPRLQAAAAGVEHGTQAFTEARLEALRAQRRVVFVNITADWCVSCKANEKNVFAREDFGRALKDTNAVYLVGDWTDVDPALTAFLQKHGAYGVPLYLVYPADGGAPTVLPTLLTPASAREALERAARPGA